MPRFTLLMVLGPLHDAAARRRANVPAVIAQPHLSPL